MKAHVLVKRAFERQKKIHGTLSLRSLAERVHVSPGFLSKVFSGQKALNLDLAEKLFKQLNMDTLQRDQVLAEMQAGLLKKKFRTARPIQQRNLRSETLAEFTLMENDAEWLLGKWYRLALLDLVTCADFVEDAAWIASRLSISKSDAVIAIKELERFGFLKRDESGRLQKTHEKLRFPTKFSKAVIREYHAMQIKRALAELEKRTDQSSFSRRLITSVGVAANPASIEKAKAILHEAMYEAAAVLSKGDATEVYQINLQFFPQTVLRK